MTFSPYITLFLTTFIPTITLFLTTSRAKVLLFFHLNKKMSIFLGMMSTNLGEIRSCKVRKVCKVTVKLLLFS